MYLASSLERAISESLERRVTDREDSWLHALFTYGLPDIAEALREAYGPSTAIAGVWCHSTPKVEFDTKGQLLTPELETGPSCEIGDLLLVTSQLVDHGPPVNRSVLLQLKRKSKPDSASSDQDYLYEHWPPFRYKAQRTEVREVQVDGGGGHAGGQYGVLFERGEGENLQNSTMAVSPTGDFGPLDNLRNGSLNRKLSNHTVQLLAGVRESGLNFEAEETVDRDLTQWSRVVWDLLKLAFVSAKNVRIHGSDQWVTLDGRSVRQSKAWNVGVFRAGDDPPALLAESTTLQPVIDALWEVTPDGGDPDAPLAPGDAEPDDGPLSVLLVQVDTRAELAD